MKPNLFDFATSELSQDAALCWLLSFADAAHSDSPVHKAAGKFLELIYSKFGFAAPEQPRVEVTKQVGGIDILCLVDGKTALIIEDKVGTIQHSDQLARYKAYAEETLGHAPDDHLPIYLQTGDQCSFEEVEKHGFRVVTRADLLELLESESGRAAGRSSDILSDFTTYLRKIEDDVQSYCRVPLANWSWNAWKGFYSALTRALGAGEWRYVANPAGGFLGFWWHFLAFDGGEVYLQLEQEKFCFKIYVADSEKRWKLRQEWHDRVVEKCRARDLRAKKPQRFGNGEYMTVAILEGEYRCTDGSGMLDLAATLRLFAVAQSVLDDCIQAAVHVHANTEV